MGEKQQQATYGAWGYLSFAWMTSVVFAAWKKQDMDLSKMFFPLANRADGVYDLFQAEWQAKQKEGAKKGQLLGVLRKLYGTMFLVAGLCKLLWGGLVITGAFFFVRSLLKHVNPKEKNHEFLEPWTGWALAAGFFVAAVLWGLALQRMNYICMDQGVKVRASLLTAVTRKAVFLATVSVEQASDIVGFVANDINKVYDGMLEFHYLWTAPIEAIVILSLLASLVKWWAAPAVVIVALVMFAQYFFGYCIARNKFRQMSMVNKRGGILQEVLPAMKLVKYYGWEKFFEDKITAIRKMESKLQSNNIFYKVINITLVFTVPPLTAFAIFSAYEFESERLKTTLAFTTLSLFNILRFPLVVLPKALRAASEGAAALSRVEEFLQTKNEEEPKQVIKAVDGINVENAVFQYPGHDGHAFKLNVPSFHVAPGEVVAVVGRVGAGKSALLDALLGNMHTLSGTVQVGGKLAFVPQVAWVQNMSIKDNILFGLPFDEAKYNDVLHACALEQDLLMLPQGDQSSCGIRGINLSGGQRQRVNIARSAYFGADTILLDNALSAVDHHTADHIFTNLVKGTFRDKAVVLVTHQLQFVRRCAKVAIVDDGDIKYFGPFTPEAQTILARYLPVPEEDVAHHDKEGPVATKRAKLAPQAVDAKPVTSLSMGASTWKFINAGPGYKLLISVAFAIIAQSTRQMSDFWVRYWAADKYGWYIGDEDTGGPASHKYAWTYGALTFGFFSFQLVRNGMLFYWAKSAADRMHKMKLHRVLNTPLTFFLVKPVGELLSTFSSDQDKTDETLPDVLLMAMIYGFILLATSVTVSITIPEFAAFAGVLLIITILMLRVYLPAATTIKNLRLSTAGSLVGLTAEVLEGLPVVQAYSHENHFVHVFTHLTDEHHRALFTAESLNLWVAFYCDFYGAVMLFAVCLFAVAEKSRGSAVIGLAFSNTIQMLVFYTWTLRLITEAISLSASVEQLTWLSYFTPIDGKDDVNNEGKPLVTKLKWKDLKKLSEEKAMEEKKVVGWPADGTIVFENVKMRYRPTAGLALAGVNLNIRHGEKVGIVGRTGSGKSTLLMAIYRMFNLAEGRITVGGKDISTLPLQQQRCGLSVVPQEPTMWTGTLRENLDPFGLHNDMEMYDLLIKVGLHQQALACGGLDGNVDGSGSDRWSLGQMQLVCLIRAALNKVPIVCFDEATAALDPHTEKHVLEVAEQLFKNRTILTVAHRLDAVIDCDTVIVMESGKVAETGPPAQLLNDPSSWFSKLVDMAGPAEAAALRATAARHFARLSSTTTW